LEIDEMDMNWMGPTTALVLQLPNLNGTTLRLCHHSFVDLRPGNTIDLPLIVAALKSEATVNASLGWWVRNGTEN
jgi:hypothetical protein